jgi:hypothetical protein
MDLPNFSLSTFHQTLIRKYYSRLTVKNKSISTVYITFQVMVNTGKSNLILRNRIRKNTWTCCLWPPAKLCDRHGDSYAHIPKFFGGPYAYGDGVGISCRYLIESNLRLLSSIWWKLIYMPKTQMLWSGIMLRFNYDFRKYAMNHDT